VARRWYNAARLSHENVKHREDMRYSAAGLAEWHGKIVPAGCGIHHPDSNIRCACCG